MGWVLCHIHGMEWWCHLHLLRLSRNGTSTLNGMGSATSTLLSEMVCQGRHWGNWIQSNFDQLNQSFIEQFIHGTGCTDSWMISECPNIWRLSFMVVSWATILWLESVNYWTVNSWHWMYRLMKDAEHENGWIGWFLWLWYGWEYDDRTQLVIESAFHIINRNPLNS